MYLKSYAKSEMYVDKNGVIQERRPSLENMIFIAREDFTEYFSEDGRKTLSDIEMFNLYEMSKDSILELEDVLSKEEFSNALRNEVLENEKEFLKDLREYHNKFTKEIFETLGL